MRAGNRPSVLHAPVEVAGQAALAVQGLREIGVDAASFSREHPFSYGVAPDYVPGPSRRDWLLQAAKAVRRHDTVHLYFGQSFLPAVARGADARLMRLGNRRVVMEFLGSDVRMPSFERARNPDYVHIPGEDDEAAIARMRLWSSISGGHVIVCDRAQVSTVQPYFDHVHVVPFRVDVASIVPVYPSANQDVPRITHAPSDKAAKGTKHVRASVAELRERGLEFDYLEIHGQSNAEALRTTATADLVIDQLCIGAHGVYAVEAWSLGKPVVCNILPDVAPTYPDGFPMIRATPRTLTSVLEDWIGRAADRAELGRKSRRYAERIHDAPVVARKLEAVYEALPGRGRRSHRASRPRDDSPGARAL